MDSTMIKDFQNRIAQASRGDLLLINYELLLLAIREGKAAIETGAQGDGEKAIQHANRLLRELIDTLDFRYDISRDLMAIYLYVSKQLITASVRMDIRALTEAEGILDSLYIGWQEANKKAGGAKPVIANAQKVYAGLTYGKGTLNESVDVDRSRGFKA